MNILNRSIIWKLVLPVPIVLVVCIVAAWFLIPRGVNENSREAAVRAAVQTVNQFKTIRGYYTKNVIKKAIANGGPKPSFNHSTEPGSIPLPATLIHDLSMLLKEQDTTITLYSAYPFPLRKDRKLDSFQREAWAFLNENPDEIYTRQEKRDGKEVVRVAVADRMVAKACVSCHNSHAGSPKTDWQMGDVRGVLEVDTDISSQIAAGTRLSNTILVGVAAAGLVLILICIGSAYRVARPMIRMTAVMKKLIDGDRSAEVPATNRRDEIGGMAQAIQVFKDNAIAMDRLQGEHAENETRAAAEKKRLLHDMADNFEVSVKGMVEVVSSAAANLQATAQKMSSTADENGERATAVASASGMAASNVQAAAGAVEEITFSIQEISQQVGLSAAKTLDAAGQAKTSNDEVQGLVEAAQRVGKVVELISDIAEQTNLLALNATIEAARAGEMGKGFAVVAGEVKSLANQTAKATDEISQQISQIQSATTGAATAIKTIGDTVEEINQIAATVASAVEEQSAAVSTISSNIRLASEGTEKVASNVGQVSESVLETGGLAEKVLTAAGELSQQSGKLLDEMNGFLENVRVA